MTRLSHRTRVLALLTAALVTGGLLASAAPAGAVTWDHDRSESSHFTVAGKRYTLSTTAIGQQLTTVHIGQSTGTVWSYWRITIKDDRGHVQHRVTRGLHKETAIVTALSRDFRTEHAYEVAAHRALTISAARAKSAYFKGLRIESVDADQETNIGQIFNYLDTLPAGAKPDFDAVTVIHSNEYRGSVSVYGSDAKHWVVVVRDTQDGVGSFYDSATGTGTRFSI
jgi:hypothetical protein